MARALVLVLVGCGAGSGPVPYDQAAFCAAVVPAFDACCPAEGLDDVACRERFFGPVRDGVADVSSGDADACRAGYERAAEDCDALSDTAIAACGDMLDGHVAIGDPCPDARLCAPGGVCVDGVCLELGGDRDPCVQFSCERGLYCNPDQDICRELHNVGDTCGAGDESQCQGDMRCVDGRCGDGIPDGAPCTTSYECRSLSCVGDRCAPAPDPTFCASP